MIFFCLYLTLVAFDKGLEVFQELDVFLVLGGGAQLHQFISKRVVNPPVSQEVHQVVVQGLETTARNASVKITVIMCIKGNVAKFKDYSEWKLSMGIIC